MITLCAPAKLTLRLSVTGTREDGMHLIDAEMVTLDLYDTLTIFDEAGPVIFEGPSAPTQDFEEDLVRQAQRVVGSDHRVVVHKRIPPGAGLGGGSADAAAILRWAGGVDPSVAALLGADVPFCQVGGRARVSGIGELVTPMEFRPGSVTLLVPPLHSSTAEVYRCWDQLGGPRHPSGNDLTEAALSVTPQLAAYRDALRAATGQEPRLAGSGSTWWVPGEYPGPDRIVARFTPSGWTP